MNFKIAMDRSMRRYDGNGHLIIEKTVISKAAVNGYRGYEIPDHERLGLDPQKIYRLLRDPDELKKGAATFNGIQLMIKHIPVSADEPSKLLCVGAIGTDVEMGEEDLTSSMRVWDQEAINLIELKKLQELSSGYAYTADMTPGTWNGEHYDGVMRNIHGNHVALVDRGRIGRDAIIADHLPDDLREKSMKLKQGSMPKIMAVLQKIKIAQDSEITAEDAEEVVKAVGDSLEEEPKATDSEPDAKAKDTQPNLDQPKATDNEPDPKENDDEEGAKKKTPAMDAALIAQDAEQRAVARVTALFEAREVVKPLVGIVGMDSAEAVYKHTLNKSGIDTQDVHPSAYKSMTEMLLKQKAMPLIAQDSAYTAPDAQTHKFISRFGV